MLGGLYQRLSIYEIAPARWNGSHWCLHCWPMIQNPKTGEFNKSLRRRRRTKWRLLSRCLCLWNLVLLWNRRLLQRPGQWIRRRQKHPLAGRTKSSQHSNFEWKFRNDISELLLVLGVVLGKCMSSYRRTSVPLKKFLMVNRLLNSGILCFLSNTGYIACNNPVAMMMSSSRAGLSSLSNLRYSVSTDRYFNEILKKILKVQSQQKPQPE